MSTTVVLNLWPENIRRRLAEITAGEQEATGVNNQAMGIHTNALGEVLVDFLSYK